MCKTISEMVWEALEAALKRVGSVQPPARQREWEHGLVCWVMYTQPGKSQLPKIGPAMPIAFRILPGKQNPIQNTGMFSKQVLLHIALF